MEQQQINYQDLNIDDIIYRNETLCYLLGYKKYVPSEKVATFHQNLHKRQLRWYAIPNVGNYCNAELRFHFDLNWLITAAIEFKKYENAHSYGAGYHGHLYSLWLEVSQIHVIGLDVKKFYKAITDYSVALYELKIQENNLLGEIIEKTKSF